MSLFEWEREPVACKRGEGANEGREWDCSVVVYVSLRSCVGRSAPSRHCCCCEKRQNKGLPVLWNPFTFAGSAFLWSHPTGTLLKLTILRSIGSINWAVTQSVTQAGRKLNSKVRHQLVLQIFFFYPVFLVCPSSFFFFFSGEWPLLKGFNPFSEGLAQTSLWLICWRGLLWILTVGRLHWSHRQEWTSRRLQRVPLRSIWGWTRLSKHEIHTTLNVTAISSARYKNSYLLHSALDKFCLGGDGNEGISKARCVSISGHVISYEGWVKWWRVC